MFLRRSAVDREPLAVTMSGVRLGERALQIGLDDPNVAGILAARPGLSGQSAMAVADETSAEKARRAVADSGAFVEITVTPLEGLPFPDGAFDVAIIHNRADLLTTLGTARSTRVLGECKRVLRVGGRVVVLETGTPSGLGAIFRSRTAPSEESGGGNSTTRGLEAAGFRAVRTLGDRDNYRFVEGMKVERGG